MYVYNPIKYGVVLLFLFAVPKKIQAQDTIFYRGDQTQLCKVLFIAKNAVCIRVDTANKLLYDTIPIGELSKIIFENGAEITFTKKFIFKENGSLKMNNRFNALKIDIPMLVPNKLSIGYERYVSSRTTVEVALGWTDNQFNLLYRKAPKNEYGFSSDDFKGLPYTIYGNFGTVGVKYLIPSLSQSSKVKLQHKLTGGYLRPEINYSVLHIQKTGEYLYIDHSVLGGNSSDGEFTDKYKAVSVAYILNFGYQFVVSNVFLMDAYVGLGVANVSQKLIHSDMQNFDTQRGYLEYSYYKGSLFHMHSYASVKDVSSSPVLQLGVRLGWVFGKNKTVHLSTPGK